MAAEQVTLKVSPLAHAELTRIKKEMEADSTRSVTYSEVIERLAALFARKVTSS